jgi:hypothetical protein
MIARAGRGRAAALLLYGGVALAACVEAVLALRLWRADLRVPFNYSGDSVFFAMMVKAVIDHGWYLTNAQLGAPGVLTLHDFPQADGIHLLLIKLLSCFSTDWALLFNVYYLLGFPLIALSAFAVLRHFRIAPVPAFVASLLYAFLPSRLMIGELHFFLAGFFQVPLAILLALWVAGDDPPLLASGAGAWRPRLALRRCRSIVAIAIALLIAGTGVYYAFFAGVLIVFAGAWSAVERRSPRHALAGLALTALIVAGLTAQSLPTLLYHRAMGPNPDTAARPVAEAEIYGLRIAPMLLPVRGHRIAALAAVTRRYEQSSALPGEAASVNLGAVGAVGFLILLGLVIGRRRARGPAEDGEALVSTLARLNLAALVFATTGGFGALFALLVSPQIRTYARMHVYIAFLALFCVALLLDRVWRALPRAGLVVSAVVVFGGLFDQNVPAMVPPYARRARDYHADAAFVKALEARLPAGAQIFQLPYLRFPEGGALPGAKLIDYDPLHPYLHSRALRWSYPTMFGRPGDAWTDVVASQPAAELVRTLIDVGFDGILVNRDGYTDGGAAIVAELAAVVGTDSEGPAGRYVFVDLRAAREKAFAGIDPAARERRRQEALDRPLLRWREGFFPPEHDPGTTFRWCPGDCEIEIENPAGGDARVSVSMRVSAAQPPASLRVTGDLWNEVIPLVPDGTPISRTLRVSPGRHRIRLRSDSAPAIAPGETRRLVFRIDEARLGLAGESP